MESKRLSESQFGSSRFATPDYDEELHISFYNQLEFPVSDAAIVFALHQLSEIYGIFATLVDVKTFDNEDIAIRYKVNATKKEAIRIRLYKTYHIDESPTKVTYRMERTSKVVPSTTLYKDKDRVFASQFPFRKEFAKYFLIYVSDYERQQNYLKGLQSDGFNQSLLALQQYTHLGDFIVNSYLDKNLNFKILTGSILRWDRSQKQNQTYGISLQYFPLLAQLIIENDEEIKNSRDLQDYNEFLVKNFNYLAYNRPKDDKRFETEVDTRFKQVPWPSEENWSTFWEPIVLSFLLDLREIIIDIPAFRLPLVVFRRLESRYRPDFRRDTFLSTSHGRAAYGDLEPFSTSMTGAPEGTTLVLIVPPNSSCFAIENISKYASEQEILFLPDCKIEPLEGKPSFINVAQLYQKEPTIPNTRVVSKWTDYTSDVPSVLYAKLVCPY